MTNAAVAAERLGWAPLQAEATALVAESSARGAALRLLGSAGVRLHCTPSAELLDDLERPAKDLDLVTARSSRGVVRELLESRGYQADRDMLVAMEGERYLYRHPATGLEVDVFVDRLEFCHTIDLRGRLALHALTIPLSDLVLHKLQIVHLTQKDLIDLAALFAAHDVDGAGPEQIDAGYIGGLLARDWGFHHTATANLATFRERVVRGALALREEHRERALHGISALQAEIEASPKSRGWRLRARVGERMQWWQDVDEDREAY